MKIYHHNDLDGRCAGAIAWRSGDCGRDQSCEIIEVDYKDIIDLSQVKKGEEIVIVDFSFKPTVMEELLKITDNIIWLDHHKTAFEYIYSKDIKGIRSENWAGCELAWLFFSGDHDMPKAVQLIGDYDKWALKFQPTCFEFYEGMKLFPNDPKSELWEDLLFKEEKVIDIISSGHYAIQYRNNYCANIRNSYGYEVVWHGYLAYVTNFFQFGSKGFGDKFDQYDFCIAYIYDGDQYTVSLYSEKIDVSEICKKYGGGGHSSAAGFVCKELPFKKKEASL